MTARFMKTGIRLLLPLAAACLLASCTSMDDRGAAAPSGEVRTVNDAEYIAVVEHMAARRGVQVHWVNPPKVRSADD